MKKKNKTISAELKAEIMAAAEIPGYIASEVARSYNISPKLLYSWRSDNKKNSRQQNASYAEPNFVEISSDIASIQSSYATLLLKKVSLEFDNFSLEVEGKLSSKKLVQLISVLEQPC